VTKIDEADAQPDWADAKEAEVLRAALPLAGELGWNMRLIAAAATAAGLSAADVSLLMPNGARDLAALLFRRHDADACSRLAAFEATALKVRERIRVAVEMRIEAAMADEAAVRKAAAFLALPSNAPLALSLGWTSADRLWRWAGDTATDENHYSKRAILSAVLASTMAVRLARGPAAADAHLKARIDNVMAFEQWKAKLPQPSGLAEHAAGWLARLRYGAAG
jgi:ubiquinone biosynthesis protein COQ9